MLYPRFKNFVSENALVREGDSIVVGVSGGIDSMALFDLFVRMSKAADISLIVAHFNHRLRGRESDADEALVREKASEAGVSIEVHRKRPAKRDNLQDAARRDRIGFFRKVASKHSSGRIATAHNLDDQAETIMLHLMRGSGSKGLSGIRPSQRAGGVELIRPILFATREEIAKYAGERGIEFREDRTNATTKYARNSVRHELMPLMKRFNPKIQAHLAMLGERIAEDDEALRAVANASFDEAIVKCDVDSAVLRRCVYSSLPPAIRKRLLMTSVERLKGNTVDLNSDQLEKMDHIAMAANRHGSYRLRASWRFERDGDMLRIAKS